MSCHDIDLRLDGGRFGQDCNIFRALTYREHRVQVERCIGIDGQVRFLLGFEACGFDGQIVVTHWKSRE